MNPLTPPPMSDEERLSSYTSFMIQEKSVSILTREVRERMNVQLMPTGQIFAMSSVNAK